MNSRSTPLLEYATRNCLHLVRRKGAIFIRTGEGEGEREGRFQYSSFPYALRIISIGDELVVFAFHDSKSLP
jgi:hypothetical protein